MGLIDVSLRMDAMLSDQREVFEYWSSLRRGREMPQRLDFQPRKLLKRLPFLSLVDVSFDASRFRFRLAGTGLRDVFGEEVTGRHLDDLPLGSQFDHWHAVYRAVARTAQPGQGFTPLLWRDRPSIIQAWLRLPMADEDGKVCVVLGYDRFVPLERATTRPTPDGEAQQAAYA